MRHPIFSPALVCVVLLSGCPARYQAPASLPDEIQVPHGSHVRFDVMVPSGGSPAPMRVVALEAACENAAVCVTESTADGTVWVYGLAAGQTAVRIGYVHPTHKDTRSRLIPVTVTEPETPAKVELGRALPRANVLELIDATDGSLWCEPESVGGWALCHRSRSFRGRDYPFAFHHRVSALLGEHAKTCIAVVGGAVVGWAMTRDPRENEYDVTGRVTSTPCARGPQGQPVSP